MKKQTNVVKIKHFPKSSSLLERVKEYKDLRIEIKQLDARLAEIKKELTAKAEKSPDEKFVIDSHLVKLVSCTTESINKENLDLAKQEIPEVIKKYIVTKISKSLRVE